ncbi:peroxiredoxin-like family protein [Methylomonas methanica]|uniref:thioredoxin-dependent peroxiredoxin n=1 Tax=Methylomonas methanica (strain DSM 25384 / MC09) TaxID=857087 RepID=F9ZVR0_METMM|nr:peroxiredoxin-like family protein [Methylomonas methanica]AEF99538.1 alkyl hydroperoxide reductase/ Thiol specific antioxidant/ Mal allergen [Methylomonas methanica MC09]
MNFLKSMYISTFMMLAMAIASYAGWRLYNGVNNYMGYSFYPGGNPWAWIGVILTTAPILMVIGWITMFKNVARTSAHLPVLNVLGLIGVGLAFWAGVNHQAPALAPALAIGGWLGFVLYSYWYSSYGRQPSTKLRVGAELPAFTVRNASGASVTSAQLTDKPAILIFFRGNWCPLCMAQVKEMVAHYQDINALGVRVALISPQPHDNTIALSKKFGVNFDFLTDEGNSAARALGIEQNHGLPMGMRMLGYASETVLPTVIIMDRDGKVIWTHETDNYRIRPEPDVYLDVLHRHRMAVA